MHRIAAIVSAFIATILTVFAAAPAAFAVIVEPSAGGDRAATAVSPAVHHAGLYGWQIALIVVLAVAVAGLAVMALGRLVQAPRRALTH